LPNRFLKRTAAVVLVALSASLPLAAQEAEEGDGDEQKIMALPVHTLGDQTLSISAGVFVPLFYQQFNGTYWKNNLKVGGTGSLQWNAYLSSAFRLGLEVSTSFCMDPNKDPLVMLPITVKGAYVLDVSRFEFPVFLGVGMTIMRYQEWSYIDLIFKPGFAAYWRYDANWSFGFNCVWWLDMQFATGSRPPEESMMLNTLEITPSIFYNF